MGTSVSPWPEGLGLTWEDTADPTGVFRPGAMTPLVPGGEAKEVTGDDVDEYLRALVAHRVIGSVKVGGCCTFTPAC